MNSTRSSLVKPVISWTFDILIVGTVLDFHLLEDLPEILHDAIEIQSGNALKKTIQNLNVDQIVTHPPACLSLRLTSGLANNAQYRLHSKRSRFAPPQPSQQQVLRLILLARDGHVWPHRFMANTRNRASEATLHNCRSLCVGGKTPSPKKCAAGPSTKYVCTWGNGKAVGDGSKKNLLGDKGAKLAEMARNGLPVPPGFTITTEVCRYYHTHNRSYPPELQNQVEVGIQSMEKIMGCKFGDAKGLPLLVAVRSGARHYTPGLMDTILNLGLNDQTVLSLAAATKNERFAWDCYRRFIQMYGDVVLGVQKREGEDHEPFESIIEEFKHARYHKDIVDSDLSAEDQKELVKQFKQLVKERTGKSFPSDPWDQLRGAAGAVFGSWMNDRAIVYRRKYNIPPEGGAAVNVQAMVYGNTGETSGSGVAFTRNPFNGVNELYGEFLTNAQGEDVVAGLRTPEPVTNLSIRMRNSFAELMKLRVLLEKAFKYMQDFEFTIQDGKVFLLTTRNAKRTAYAAIRVAIEMTKETIIDWKTAVTHVPADQLSQLFAPVFEPAALKGIRVLASGIPAGPGVAVGRIYLNADRAVAANRNGEKVILVRNEVSPEDLRGMIASEGILTTKGGVSSHAALITRQMAKVCICGASAVVIDYNRRLIVISGQNFEEGDYLSLDGTNGLVYPGRMLVVASSVVRGICHESNEAKKGHEFRNYAKLMKWSSRLARLKIRANADAPEQVRQAIALGANGIGLCRTEHMFFGNDRIDAMREMIMSGTATERERALAKLLPMQRDDFRRIFLELKGLPVTIRLFDPPLHEFLPTETYDQEALAEKLSTTVDRVARRAKELAEANPMLGNRGCRLGITYPEIIRMQIRAIFEAAAQVQMEGTKATPEIMIPHVGFKKEFDLHAALVHDTARDVQRSTGQKLRYLVGAMIEVPRSALTTDELAESAEFLSFGTNDLTQMTLGISRDDMGAFITSYTENEIFKKNPFASLDQIGVGSLMKNAVCLGRITRPDIEIGICGEHGGDPESIAFCHQLRLNHVSCSPYQIPIAQLAAAQAALAQTDQLGAKLRRKHSEGQLACQ